VYRARDTERDRAVALRVFRGPTSEREAEAARVAPRLLTAARFAHPRLVRPLDLGRAEGQPFVAFEHVAGLTLEEKLTAEGRLPVLAALEIGRDVARGLAAIHAAGEVHEDLRADRVFVEAGGRARLGGWGLSPGPLPSSERSWTAALPAPERAWGAPSSAGTDLYALGGLLYLLLAGRLPYDPTDARALTEALDRRAPDVREARAEVPEPVAALVARLLEPSADRRPRSAAEVADRLARAAVITEGVGGAEASPRLRIRWSAVAAWSAAGGALTALAGAGGALAAAGAGRAASTTLGAAAFVLALILAGSVELMRQGQVPLALGARGWVRARDGLGLFGSALLVGGGIGPSAAGLDVVLAVSGWGAGLAWSLGGGLRREIARARPDRGRGRTLAVLGDLRLGRWRRYVLPALTGVAVLASLRWLSMAYFASPAAGLPGW
jgi:hypothetical protein